MKLSAGVGENVLFGEVSIKGEQKANVRWEGAKRMRKQTGEKRVNEQNLFQKAKEKIHEAGLSNKGW